MPAAARLGQRRHRREGQAAWRPEAGASDGAGAGAPDGARADDARQRGHSRDGSTRSRSSGGSRGEGSRRLEGLPARGESMVSEGRDQRRGMAWRQQQQHRAGAHRSFAPVHGGLGRGRFYGEEYDSGKGRGRTVGLTSDSERSRVCSGRAR